MLSERSGKNAGTEARINKKRRINHTNTGSEVVFCFTQYRQKIKPKRLRWSGLVESMGETQNVCQIGCIILKKHHTDCKEDGVRPRTGQDGLEGK